MSNSPFLNSIRMDMRQKGYAFKTEKTYLHWIKRFILFHQKRHPQTIGSEEVRQFLSHLANDKHVATNTQKIALNALAFLYNKFLQQPLGDIDYIPASKLSNLPIVISVNEVQRILQAMEAPFGSLMNIKKRAALTDLRVFYSLVIPSLAITALCVFFTQLLGCCHHVFQCAFGFWPSAGF